MLYKSNNNCNFVEQHSTRYSYAFTEVRGEPFGGGAQTAHQDREVGREVRQDHLARKHSSRRGQEWEEAHDGYGSRRSLQHFAYHGAECADEICNGGAQVHYHTEEAGDTSCSSQMHGGCGSKNHSDSVQCAAGRPGQMDAAAIVGTCCGTGNSSFHIAYACRSHSKKTGISLT